MQLEVCVVFHIHLKDVLKNKIISYGKYSYITAGQGCPRQNNVSSSLVWSHCEVSFLKDAVGTV